MSFLSKIFKKAAPKKSAKPVSVAKKKTAPAKAKISKKVKTAKSRLARPKPVGKVTHFFGNIEVAIVKFNKPVKVGARVEFKGATTDFSETIKSMQFDHKPIAI